jgi:hypothetical protein
MVLIGVRKDEKLWKEKEFFEVDYRYLKESAGRLYF